MTGTERRKQKILQRRVERRAARRAANNRPFDDFQTVFSYEHLYLAYLKQRSKLLKTRAGQRFCINAPLNLLHIHTTLMAGNYQCAKFNTFVNRTRGKRRTIYVPSRPEDRVVLACLTMFALTPVLSRSLIYDNCSGLEQRGVSFAARRAQKHLRDQFRRCGSGGYALVFDIKDFYQSIPRKWLYIILRRHFKDESIVRLTAQACEMFGDNIGLGVGPIFSQILAQAYSNRIDHLIKEELRIDGYVRYGDDGIIIHESKEYLQYCLARLKKLTGLMKLQFNGQKTHIVRLTHGWRWLKIRWWMEEDGKIVKKLNPDVVTHYRQKFKKLRALLDRGETTREYIAKLWYCWKNLTGTKHREGRVLPFNYECHFARLRMAELIYNLFGEWEGYPDALYQAARGW